MLKLTDDNYYTVEADQEYMSCSQYDEFMTCEAAAMARLHRRYERPKNKAFLVGNYFHSYMEGKEAHEKFLEEHYDDVFKTKTNKKTGEITITGKYADYENADKMIAAAESEPAIKKLIDMPGEVETIMAGKIGQHPWKIKLDKYIPDLRMIIDWKTVADIWELRYSPAERRRVSFVDSYGYMMRAAVYCEIEKQVTGQDTDPAFILACISKQDPPDKELISMTEDRQRMDYELDQMKDNLFRIGELKAGRARPTRCGHCEYCRATKHINGIINYYDLDPDKRPAREEEYDAYFQYSGT
ncbi:MAG: PD-(D/E)XK nuclease-like domain-containing protein [Eubacteriaceae bacterium]|nr:PD-(D/E)XK nuclease-like domain-containing protein [Eubacteriaceae bacterium]